ncbi:ATP-binding cassette domain-containing protein [Polymorphospora lycopeni]|uniref:ATP-binding cassette domain-containing protein n=1 Tax=Polymorphospora lycopeni TaxID=3140240 RepID=A0ABV5CUC8_9ACTN
MISDCAIEVEGLHKRFRRTHALRGLDLRVAAGTVCALLGRNGAGKTTAVRVMTTLTRPDAGQVRVAGYDVVREAETVRRNIGLAGQYAAVDDDLTGRENLWVFGRLHHLDDRTAKARAAELLARFDLAGEADRPVKGYSGGMRRRLDLMASLITAPPVLFLDEPTTGLDPGSRRQMWRHIADLVAAGTSVLLTTQYLDEADSLADQIVVVDQGRELAAGTPAELKSAIGIRVDVVLRETTELAAAAGILAGFASAEPEIDHDQRTVRVAVPTGAITLPVVVRQLDAAGLVVEDVALRQPSLDAVFFRLTERAAGAGADRAGG